MRRAGFSAADFAAAKFLRQRRIAQWLGVEIHQVQPDAVLHFAIAEVVQTRRPLPILHQIIGHVLREEDVPGIAAIHHPLRHVDAGPGDVGAAAHVGHFAHRPAMDSHPDRKFRMLPQRFGDLERAPRRFLRAVVEDQRHPIAGRQPNELFVGRVAHLRRREHDRGELVQALLLFLDQELRVTDDVDEEDMPDFEAKIVFGFRHGLFLPEPIRCGDVFLRRRF